MKVYHATYSTEQIKELGSVAIPIPDEEGGTFLFGYTFEPVDYTGVVVYSSVQDQCEHYDELYDAMAELEADPGLIVVVQRNHQHNTGVDLMVFHH